MMISKTKIDVLPSGGSSTALAPAPVLAKLEEQARTSTILRRRELFKTYI